MRKLAIVTGASRGIGEAIVRKFASLGFDVALVARSLSAMDEIATETMSSDTGANLAAFAIDLAKPDQVNQIYGDIERHFGRSPCVLINNAGYGGPYLPIDSLSVASWQEIMAVNLDSSFALSRLVVRAMADKSWGRIINVSSVYGHLGGSGSGAYSAAKHALLGLTKTLAAEYGAKGVTANAICPGYIDTPMLSGMKSGFPEVLARIVEQVPAKRLGAASEIAAVAAFLVSDDAAYINGSEIVVDGGLSSHVGYF